MTSSEKLAKLSERRDPHIWLLLDVNLGSEHRVRELATA